MKITILACSLLFLAADTKAQQAGLKDSFDIPGKVTVYKDYRLDLLAKKEAEFNEAQGVTSSGIVRQNILRNFTPKQTQEQHAERGF